MKAKQKKTLVFYREDYMGESRALFYGDYSRILEFENFKLSVVNYTQLVSEDWHYHDKKHISAIISGGNLESRKSRDIQVMPGNIMIYEAGEVHRNRFTAHPSINLNIEFNDNFFEDDINFSKIRMYPNTLLEFHKIYLELLGEDSVSDEIEYQVKSLFTNDHDTIEGPWMVQLKDLLNDRWNEFISLDELSAELHIHPVTISKYFTKKNNMTLSEYMRRLKVKRALDLIINSEQAFATIAYTCGFSDQSHMNRLVKHFTGLTPIQIRTLN